MGKIGGPYSWLNVVKQAFRSPTKDSNKSSKRREGHEQQDDEKKRGKRRWIFRTPCIYETTIQAKNITASANASSSHTGAGTSAMNNLKSEVTESEQRHTIAMAMATTEAAVATAQAAMEVIRLARPSNNGRKHYAAIVIQTAFRGYLSRRARRALHGIVKLQALVRGHNVRKRAKMTLKCIQSMVRVQAEVSDQRRRLSYQRSMESTFSESISRDGSSITDEWDGHQHKLEEIKARLQKTKEATSKREKKLSYAFSHQIWSPGKDLFLSDQEQEKKPRWCDQVTVKQREMLGRNSFDPIASPIKPFPSKTKPLQVHTSSPRCLKEEKNFIVAQTPNLRSSYYGMAGLENGGAASMPNYMAATASANARILSQSVPRQRPLTPERQKMGHAKKRLSFPIPEPDYYHEYREG